MYTSDLTSARVYNVTERTHTSTLTIVAQAGRMIHATLSNNLVPHTQSLAGVLETDCVSVTYTEPKGQGEGRPSERGRIQHFCSEALSTVRMVSMESWGNQPQLMTFAAEERASLSWGCARS